MMRTSESGHSAQALPGVKILAYWPEKRGRLAAGWGDQRMNLQQG